MKGLKKLALVTAVAAAPFAQAEMTAMDDALLGEMTGQAGITIDVDLQMTIDAIKYVDLDGNADGSATQGAITMKGLTIDNDGGAAFIRGITIDADGTDGLVIGLNQIGNAAGGIDISVDSIMINNGAADATAIAAGANLTGQTVVASAVAAQGDATVNGTAQSLYGKDFTELSTEEQLIVAGANAGNAAADQFTTDMNNHLGTLAAAGVASGNIGGFVIEDFRNYVEDSIVSTYNGRFDMALNNVAGNYVKGEIVVNGTGNAVAGTGGLSIQAKFGGLMDKIAWTDGYGADTDATPDGLRDGGEFGVKDMAFFNAVDNDLDTFKDTIEALVFNVDINVVDHESWDNATPGTANVAALELSNMKIEGSIIMGNIYLGSSTDTVTEQSLGSVLIKDIDMTGTAVTIYGH